MRCNELTQPFVVIKLFRSHLEIKKPAVDSRLFYFYIFGTDQRTLERITATFRAAACFKRSRSAKTFSP